MIQRRIIPAILLVVLALLWTGAQAQQLPSFSDNAAGPAQTANTLTTDYLQATINGEQKVLALESCTLGAYNSLMLSYESQTPLGGKEWNISLFFTLGDAAGTVYQSEVTQGLGMTLTSPSMVMATYYPKWQLFGATSSNSLYKLTITSRSADWRSYTGTFSATLKTPEDAFGGAQQSVEITDGYFSCSYTGN